MKKLLWAILATAIIAGTNPETCYAKKKSKKNDKKEQVKDTTAKESKRYTLRMTTNCWSKYPTR